MISNSLCLFNHFFDKEKNIGLTPDEKIIYNLLLQLDVISHYFEISYKYLDHTRIKVEADALYPDGTWHESFYWFCYHYESFGNALYAYKEAWEDVIKITLNIPRNARSEELIKHPSFVAAKLGQISLLKTTRNFWCDQKVIQILTDRGDSVHEFGRWRVAMNKKYLTLMKFDEMEKDLKTILKDVIPKLRSFEDFASEFVLQCFKQK